jgi:hypothetical protein
LIGGVGEETDVGETGLDEARDVVVVVETDDWI